MNLDSIGRAKAESTLKVLHPATAEVIKNDDGSEMTITLFGEYSDEWKQAFYDLTTERMQKARETGKTSFTPKEREDEVFELTCRCTKGWTLTDTDGPVKFTPEKVRETYKVYPWVYQQARAFMENSSNFLDPSAKT